MTASEHPNATRIAEFFAVMDAADDPEAAYALLRSLKMPCGITSETATTPGPTGDARRSSPSS
jgi:hypothetical protein